MTSVYWYVSMYNMLWFADEFCLELNYLGFGYDSQDDFCFENRNLFAREFGQREVAEEGEG